MKTLFIVKSLKTGQWISAHIDGQFFYTDDPKEAMILTKAWQREYFSQRPGVEVVDLPEEEERE